MGMEAKINKSAKSLTGFNGATSITVGMVELDVYSTPVISAQTFMIIDKVSPTMVSWADYGLERSPPSLLPGTRKSATQSPGVVSTRLIAIRQW